MKWRSGHTCEGGIELAIYEGMERAVRLDEIRVGQLPFPSLAAMPIHYVLHPHLTSQCNVIHSALRPPGRGEETCR